MDIILMRLWMLSSIMFASISVQAQKIQTVDTEGNPVGYASVSDADNGRLIGMINRYSDLSINNVALKSKDSASKLKLVKETPERQRVLYQDSLIGYLVDDKKDHKRRLSIDNNLYKKFYHADNDSERKAKKREKRNEKKKNETSTRYMVYNLDDDGNCGVADFVSKQIHSDYDKYSKINKKDEHRRLWVEVYATDRAYVTKQELKEKKRENKMKMSYEALMQFERQHGIPAMPENTKKSLEELLSK